MHLHMFQNTEKYTLIGEQLIHTIVEIRKV